ncbi:hypothetical protein [Xaviernesmea oryzae]|uniref:hypothetical protein n=1 Tax=Xaviernesmea oryzae TaxID=464029 RepID=UPI0011143AE9|nr:hypothetical protein [Xaviernesmea oryzae]
MILKPPDRRNSADHVSLSSIFNCQKTESKAALKPTQNQPKTTPNQPHQPQGPTRQKRRHPADPVGKHSAKTGQTTKTKKTSARSAATPRSMSALYCDPSPIVNGFKTEK